MLVKNVHLWVVGGERALLTLDLFAQVLGVDMTGDVLRHFGCELAVSEHKTKTLIGYKTRIEM